MIKTVTHTASGASFSVHPYGATVTSYKSATGRETLFLSQSAVLDGSKAIRGGIPLVFPIFGPPKEGSGSTMPQHGFARVNNWSVVEGSEYDHDEVAGIKLSLSLKDATAGRGEHNDWSVEQAEVDGTDCTLEYEITVSSTSLITALIVKNTGSVSFAFNALQHTYLAIDDHASNDPAQCFIKGLYGYTDLDKADPTQTNTKVGYAQNVVVDGEIDRVYVHPERVMTLKAEVGVGAAKTVKVEATGIVEETLVPVSCVVWNPGMEKAKAMGDFGDEEFKDMVCVEPGLLGHQPLLGPGKEARLTQILYA